jgi:signal recognition particle receptor subunit beta
MLDSSDQTAIQTARNELETLMSTNYLLNLPILVLSNKSDLQNSKPLSQVIDFFKEKNVYSPLWNIISTSMANREGVDFVERWLHDFT